MLSCREVMLVNLRVGDLNLLRKLVGGVFYSI